MSVFHNLSSRRTSAAITAAVAAMSLAATSCAGDPCDRMDREAQRLAEDFEGDQSQFFASLEEFLELEQEYRAEGCGRNPGAPG